MKQIFSALVLLLAAFPAISQTQGVAFSTVGKGVATPFVTDYHSLGINVSALGWGTGYEGKRFTVGSTEFNFGVFSEELDSDKLKSFTRALYRSAVSKDNDGFDYEAQKKAAAEYAEAGIGATFDFNWAGFAFQNEKFGGIAFNIRENYQYYSKLNRTTTDILFRGKLANIFDSLTLVFGNDTSTVANYQNMSPDSLRAVIEGKLGIPLSVSKITEGSRIKMVWNRSYNIGYGRKIFGDSSFALYGGVGARLIQSMAMFDLESNNGLRVSTSITPAFDIDYGNIGGSNFIDYKGGIPPAVGNGYGLDFALSAMLFKKLRISAAVNNIGSVTYTKNSYTVRDSLIGAFNLNGISNETDITQTVNQLLREGGILSLQGTEKIKVNNAADFRIGASFVPMNRLRLGIDVVAPFDKENPGSLQNAVVSVGGDFAPLKWLVLNAGYFGGGVYKSNVPLGITFVLRDGAYEFGFASRDALSFFTKNSHSVSLAMCIARFRF
jgi:hypothetical protein